MTQQEKSISDDAKGKPKHKNPAPSIVTDRPQRYSVTSGMEQVPVVKRTWTVGDVDDGEAHRGGVKHAKAKQRGRGGKSGRSLGTGVNSIPVG